MNVKNKNRKETNLKFHKLMAVPVLRNMNVEVERPQQNLSSGISVPKTAPHAYGIFNTL
jgi:hypothetical protein